MNIEQFQGINNILPIFELICKKYLLSFIRYREFNVRKDNTSIAGIN